MKSTLYFAFAIFTSLYSSAQVDFQQTNTVQASNLASSKRFGFGIGMSDSVAVFGGYSSYYNLGASNQISRAGSAYIWEKDSTGWVESQEVFAARPTVDDRFGQAAAADNHTVIIGAPEEDEDQNDVYRVLSAGSVFIYTKDSTETWVLSQKIVASDRSVGAYFGSRLQLNGNLLIVSALSEGANNSGAVYIFERNPQTGLFHELQKLSASIRQDDAQFGYSVSIDDNYVVVGAAMENITTNMVHQYSGAAYVFARGKDGLYHQTNRFQSATPEASLHFGSSVFISGRHMVIGSFGEKTDSTGNNPLTGAGAVFYYKRNSSNQWVLEQKITAPDRQGGDFFGHSLSLSNHYLLVSSPKEDSDPQGNNIISNAGSAYTFRMNNQGHWSPMQKLTADSIHRTRDAHFGYECAMYNDEIALGAPLQSVADSVQSIYQGGRAYLFKTDCLSFTEQFQETCRNYTWIDGITYSTNDPDPSFILSDVNGCDSVVHLELRLQVDTAVFHVDTLLTAADSTADQYQWIDCDNGNTPITGANSPIFAPSANGHYALVISKNGCSDTSQCFQISTISLSESKLQLLEVYPNPGSEVLMINCPVGFDQTEILITDSQGRTLYHTEQNATNQQFISTNLWSAGVYFITVTSDNSVVGRAIWVKQ